MYFNEIAVEINMVKTAMKKQESLGIITRLEFSPRLGGAGIVCRLRDLRFDGDSTVNRKSGKEMMAAIYGKLNVGLKYIKLMSLK